MTHAFRTLFIISFILAGQLLEKDLLAGCLLLVIGSICGAAYDEYNRREWSKSLYESEALKADVRTVARKFAPEKAN